MSTGTEDDRGVTEVGDRCFFMVGSHVGHDCKVGNHVVFANNTVLGGHVTIGDHVVFGGGVAVRQFVRIGEGAMIVGLSGVRADVIPFGMAHGPLADLIGLNMIGMRRRGLSKADVQRVRSAYQALFFGEGEFRARIDQVTSEYGADPLVNKIIEFIRGEATIDDGRHAQRRGRGGMSAVSAVSGEGPLAMLCGGGSLPLAVAEKVTRSGRSVLLFPLRGAAEGTAVERFPHHWLHIGQIGRFMRLARAAGCRDVVFIGSLVRPSLWQVHPDLKGLSVLPRVIAAYRGGDNHLLTGMGKVLEHDGFRLLGAHEVAPDILIPEGTLGRVQASERDRADIALGLDYLQTAGKFDIGQAVVVAGLHVLAVEAAEGTDAMLARVAEMRASGRVRAPRGAGTLVKAPKPAQDRRFDLPSIGPRTVEGVIGAGLAGIAVVAGSSIVAEAEQLVSAADRANIFVLGVPSGQDK